MPWLSWIVSNMFLALPALAAGLVQRWLLRPTIAPHPLGCGTQFVLVLWHWFLLA